MITVPEAARRIRRNPETVRRWIREGRLPSTRIGTQYLVDEQDLDALEPDELLPVPPGWWETMPDGRPLPDYLTVLRRQRSEH
jgi:excisionase family DNA binding protein